MKNKWLVLGALFMLTICSCSDDENNTIIYKTNNNLITDFKLAIGEEKEVVLNAGAGFTAYMPGIQSTDQIVMEKDGTTLNVPWGFVERLDGVGDDGLAYYADSVCAKLERRDEWTIGEWNVKVRRGQEEDPVGKVNLVLLANKDIDYNSNIDMITIDASGWESTSDTLIYRSEEGFIIKVETGATSENQSVKLTLPKDEMTDGPWTLNINRWEFGLTEKLLQFDFIKKGFVDDSPITKDPTDGKYKVYFKLDEILANDAISVRLPKGTTTSIKLNTQKFDTETHILTLILPDDKVQEGTYTFAMRRNGIIIMSNLQKSLIK